MNRWRKWIGVTIVVAALLGGSVVRAESSSSHLLNKLASLNVTGPANSPRIQVLPVATNQNLPGTLSGLTRDPAGFYWSHTDGGSATTDWVVKLAKLKVTANGTEILEVIPMRDENGDIVTGDKLDPEDITVAPDGTLWMVDEIYPAIVHVSRDGQILQRVMPPEKYKGRTPGRGFEGGAMSPDGRTLYVMLQWGLSTESDKSHTWLLAYDTVAGTFKEYPYQLDRPSEYDYPQGAKPWIGTNGLAAVGTNELLVIERDNLSGADARVKRLYHVTVPDQPTAEPLKKDLAVDVHALGYVLEKLEGVAVGNSNTLLLINDNDANPNVPTNIWMLQF